MNLWQQPYRYTSYERDGDGVDQAVMRSYHGWWTRFNESDPWDWSYDLTDPQSFNRYTYVQNDPVNFADPTGMLTVGPVNGGQLGVVTVRADAGPDWTALWELWMFGMQMDQRLLPPLIDGPPELPAVTPPQNPTSTPQPNIRQQFKSFLRTMSQDCKDALRQLPGNVLGKLQKLADTVRFYDVNRFEQARASAYVGGLARAGERLGQWFDRQGVTAYTAVRVPRPGIYSRGGESVFAGGEAGMYFLLHEMVHLAYPVGRDLDRSLGRALRLTRGPGETWSDAVSRFFNSRCTKRVS